MWLLTELKPPFMVVIKEHKTYFLSSRLHLPHGVGGRGTYSYFPPHNLRKYQWGKWKWKIETYFKFHPTSFNILHGRV
jgi:hypothetical protein